MMTEATVPARPWLFDIYQTAITEAKEAISSYSRQFNSMFYIDDAGNLPTVDGDRNDFRCSIEYGLYRSERTLRRDVVTATCRVAEWCKLVYDNTFEVTDPYNLEGKEFLKINECIDLYREMTERELKKFIEKTDDVKQMLACAVAICEHNISGRNAFISLVNDVKLEWSEISGFLMKIEKYLKVVESLFAVLNEFHHGEVLDMHKFV